MSVELEGRASSIRQRIALFTCVVFFMLFSVVTILAPIGITTKLILLFLALAFLLACNLGFKRLLYDYPFFIMYSILVAFLWVAYFLKFAFTLHDPGWLWASDNLAVMSIISTDGTDLSQKFMLVIPAFCLFLFGFVATRKIGAKPRNRRLKTDTPLANSEALIVAAIAILVVRIVGFLFFGIGTAAAEGRGLPTIVIAGYELFVHNSAIILLNILFYTALRCRYTVAARVLFVCLCVNVLISLMAGEKGDMVAQVVAGMFYAYEFSMRVHYIKRIRYASLVGIFVIFALLIYPYVNPYRHALRGADTNVLNAIAVQSYYQDASSNSGNGIGAIFKRLSGFSTYYVSMSIGEGQRQPPEFLLANDMSRMLKFIVFGDTADDVKVGFGGSQFSALFLVGGIPLLMLGSTLLGASVRLVSNLIFYRVIQFKSTVHAVIPFMAFFWVSTLLAGGNYIFILKKLFIITISLYFLERVLFRFSPINVRPRQREKLIRLG